MDAKYVKYWQHRGAEERTAELVAEFKRNKMIETGPSVDDYDPGFNDFFEEDEPLADVLAAFAASEKHLTQPPTDGAGWCAPSP